MAKKFDSLSTDLQSFIKEQKVFFVGTAAETGRVNVSPKGMDTLRVLDDKKLIWLNLTGSGNETAAHLLQNDRMTIMFCSFEEKPLILRLYGTAKIFHSRDKEYDKYLTHFEAIPGARQIIELTIDLVQTSCGFAVPLMDFKEERMILKDWAQKQGEDRLVNYRLEKNVKSIDDFDTGLVTNQ